GRIGYGQSITTINAAGEVVTTCTLADLFTEEERAGLLHTVSSYRWLQEAWIDEDAGEVIVLGGGKFFAASFETPNLRAAGDAELIRALEHGGERGAQIALELLHAQKLESLRHLYEGLYAEDRPLATRLRAGLALAQLGDNRAASLFTATVSEPGKIDAEDLRFALKHLRVVLGEKGLPLLRASMRGPAGKAWSAAIEGFVNYGEAALPMLIEMLREIEESNDYRGGAANALQNIGSKAALEPLLQAVSDREEYVAHLALVAAIQIDSPGVAPRLTELLEQDTTQLARLLLYFQDQKYAAALPALRRLYDSTTDAADRKRIASAIAFQSED
ncbi:MAG: HEAT repeat domain-containing protein, partial [Planctomycetota bacterium]